MLTGRSPDSSQHSLVINQCFFDLSFLRGGQQIIDNVSMKHEDRFWSADTVKYSRI